jgi:transposase
MFPVSSSLHFYLYRSATDMRKSFDGLCGLISTELDRDALSGDVYVFLNRRRDRIKLLVWDRGGFWIFYKRLEKGTFQLPADAQNSVCIQLPYEELLMLIEGIDLASIKRRRRYDFAKKH